MIFELILELKVALNPVYLALIFVFPLKCLIYKSVRYFMYYFDSLRNIFTSAGVQQLHTVFMGYNVKCAVGSLFMIKK